MCVCVCVSVCLSVVSVIVKNLCSHLVRQMGAPEILFIIIIIIIMYKICETFEAQILRARELCERRGQAVLGSRP